jgi:hypothetical protein
MANTRAYWIGKRPSDAKRWQSTTSGSVLDQAKYRQELYKLYRRYAKQWNDIELDKSRPLSEHAHEICGAKVVGTQNKFVLCKDEDRDIGWILEVSFRRGFKQYYPGFSAGLNALRNEDDVSRIVLHWRGEGRENFDAWLARERVENCNRGEWTEYKA